MLTDFQITKVALERSEFKRGQFRVRYGNQYTPEQTVFVDESSFDRRTAIRGRAWALSGQRAERKCFFVRGRRYDLLLVYHYVIGLLVIFQKIFSPACVIIGWGHLGKNSGRIIHKTSF